MLSRAWRLARLPLAAAVLGALAGVAAGSALGPSWQVESTVAFTPTSQDPLLFANANSAVAERELAEATSFLLSQDVLTTAARALGSGERWTDLQDALTATPQPGSNVITLTGSADDAGRATARVEAVTAAFADRSRQQVVEEADRTAAAARASAQGLPASQRAALDDIAARAAVAARTADPVQVLGTRPPVRTRPVPWRDGATGAVLGLIAASAVLVLLAARPSRVLSGRDAGELLGLPWGTVRGGEVARGSEGQVLD
ncbi:YveK family protein, partial [Kineococcus indalonis]|uniref:hypothetical protein n=1 Tax=Kineococcus indalonis TaxID=2696566 RepID=UPI00196B9909